MVTGIVAESELLNDTCRVLLSKKDRSHESVRMFDVRYSNYFSSRLYANTSVTSYYITLHYITSFHTPITPTVTNGASTKSFQMDVI